MSDRPDELARVFEDEVLRDQLPRSIGLFTIPEYPELEAGGHGMWSTALEVILTTLRYLAPATLLTIFWGQQSFLFKLLKTIDSAFRSIVSSSEVQKESLLKWLTEAGSVQVDSLEVVWQHGWIVCGVLDAALPGTCAGHLPTTISLKHAQTIADQYLGVEPVFSRQELESINSLTKHQESKLITYLNSIRQALDKLTPTVPKPNSKRNSSQSTQFTLDYIAKGSGLIAAQLNNKSYFKVYPTAQQSLDPGEITVLIKGPRDIYGLTVMAPILGKAQKIRQELLGLEPNVSFTTNVLPITQGATYLRNYGRNNMNKTYYIPEEKYDIKIDVILKDDYAKVGYMVEQVGKYEISITSRGQNIIGSPFVVKSSNNIVEILENESYNLEDGEEIDIVDVQTDRKVVLRIVDFVTEKMLLNENGTLEKISDEEAKRLINSESPKEELDKIYSKHSLTYYDKKSKNVSKRFSVIVQKIIKLNRTCRIFLEHLHTGNEGNFVENIITPRCQQYIPDIINSTLIDTSVTNTYTNNCYKEDKYLVPENITVPLCTQKSEVTELESTISSIQNIPLQANMQQCNAIKPFITHNNENNSKVENTMGSFVSMEYETNNPQSEELEPTPIKIITDEENATFPPNNLFREPNYLPRERPKTPVLKIISGEINNRDVYVDPKKELTNNLIDDEFEHPFWRCEHFVNQCNENDNKNPVTDFIIGAPVSIHPIIKTSSPEPDIASILVMTRNDISDCHSTERVEENFKHLQTNSSSRSGNVECSQTQSSFYSFESNTTSLGLVNSQNKNVNDDTHSEREYTAKKELWDSAYVSIDDNSSCPDNNNNNNDYETPSKQKAFRSECCSEEKQQLAQLGPAEREIWENEFVYLEQKAQEQAKFNKSETKRSLFKPILEESDRNISIDMKDCNKPIPSAAEIEKVSAIFRDLDNMYKENFPNSETVPNKMDQDSNSVISKNQFESGNVNSASDKQTDVKRHINKMEGVISEVQANVAESVSVSCNLHVKQNDGKSTFEKNEKHFGDDNITNIVLEKKKYWDDRIRQIEVEEKKLQQKKRKLSPKHVRQNDSLTKRKGKQIVKKILNVGEHQETISKLPSNNNDLSKQMSFFRRQNSTEESEIRLVENWKKYWDNKLLDKSDELESKRENIKSTKDSPEPFVAKENFNIAHGELSESNTLPLKQELPEEVFRAFETSPKRFFGTSRKQILSKIDSFMVKANSTEREKADEINPSHESGLVSSRISLFHNISKSEELSKKQRKSQSLHNLYQNNELQSTNYARNSGTINSHHYLHNQSRRIDNTQSVNQKRGRFSCIQHTSFDETKYYNTIETKPQLSLSFNTDHNKIYHEIKEPKEKNSNIHKTTLSKSEMDIFNKTMKDKNDDSLEKHKSVEELPKINVKSFISLYESVTKCSKAKNQQRPKNTRQHDSTCKQFSSTGSVNIPTAQSYPTSEIANLRNNFKVKNPWTSSYTETVHTSIDTDVTDNSIDSIDIEIISIKDTNADTDAHDLKSCASKLKTTSEQYAETYLERDSETNTDYKSRFKVAKKFFQSLEELSDTRTTNKINECEMMLYKSNESLQKQKPRKRFKKILKSHSMPSSEISKAWKELQESPNIQTDENKLVKISERFNVEDLFNDVIMGRLSREGSLRGIPHKKAVLETFRSMENVSGSNLSPYELSISQLKEFAKENEVKNAQTYLTEYPYLPKTDPSKYRSRLDAQASGLVTMKELLQSKPRRNSVPDLRVNPHFTLNL